MPHRECHGHLNIHGAARSKTPPEKRYFRFPVQGGIPSALNRVDRLNTAVWADVEQEETSALDAPLPKVEPIARTLHVNDVSGVILRGTITRLGQRCDRNPTRQKR
jgi:hypothetical protein